MDNRIPEILLRLGYRDYHGEPVQNVTISYPFIWFNCGGNPKQIPLNEQVLLYLADQERLNQLKKYLLSFDFYRKYLGNQLDQVELYREGDRAYLHLRTLKIVATEEWKTYKTFSSKISAYVRAKTVQLSLTDVPSDDLTDRLETWFTDGFGQHSFWLVECPDGLQPVVKRAFTCFGTHRQKLWLSQNGSWTIFTVKELRNSKSD